MCKAHQQADANDQQPTDQDIPPHDAVTGDRCSTVMEKEVVIRDVQFPRCHAAHVLSVLSAT